VFLVTSSISSCLLQLSPWTLVLLTVERFICVWNPFKCRELCSRRRIIVVWLGMVVTTLIANTVFFFMYDVKTQASGNNVKTPVCASKNDYLTRFWLLNFFWISFLCRTAIPFIMLLGSNAFIVSRIIRSSRQRTVRMQAARSDEEKSKAGKVIS